MKGKINGKIYRTHFTTSHGGYSKHFLGNNDPEERQERLPWQQEQVAKGVYSGGTKFLQVIPFKDKNMLEITM